METHTKGNGTPKYFAEVTVPTEFAKDRWRNEHHTLEINDETTIGDIMKWTESDLKLGRMDDETLLILKIFLPDIRIENVKDSSLPPQ